jgi:hypothetical protein
VTGEVGVVAADSCSLAVENAIATLEALPGFAGTAIEVGLSLSALLALDLTGVGGVAAAVIEANAIAALIRTAVAEATAISVTAAATLNQAINCIASFIASLSGGLTPSGGHTVVATAPVPTVTEAAGLGVCSTRSGNKGICCAAVTQLGLARAAQGFQYTNCNGRVVCLQCGTRPSTSKKHPGQTVFTVRRASCGPSGCPALGQ